MTTDEILVKRAKFEDERDEHLANKRPVSASMVQKTINALTTYLKPKK